MRSQVRSLSRPPKFFSSSSVFLPIGLFARQKNFWIVEFVKILRGHCDVIPSATGPCVYFGDALRIGFNSRFHPVRTRRVIFLTPANHRATVRDRPGGVFMRLRNSFFKQIFVAAVVSLLAATTVFADVTGSILGAVKDRSQGVVAGAKIVVTNAETNFRQEATSGADGSFRFLVLPVGVYKLSVTANGFRPFEESNIELKVNDQLRFDVVLDVGNVNEKVEISANAVQVQTENTQLGDVIDSKKMLALPLNGRSYIDLLGLQAGVAPTSAETIQQDRPRSGGLNPGNISVNGQRETANAFLVNGGDVSEGGNLR